MYPQEIELTIDDIAQGGDGVGRWEGRVVFATGGLPGERVRVSIHDRKSDFARGVVTEVLEASPDRIEPRLPGADHMSWQHIAYPAQLRFKRSILEQQLVRLGGLRDVQVAEMLAAPQPWGYRNTAYLHVQDGKIGYYAAGSRRLVEIDHDPLLLPVLNEALTALRETLQLSPVKTASSKAKRAEDDRLQGILLRASATYGYAMGVLDGGDDLAGTAWRWRLRDSSLAGVLYPDPEAEGEIYTNEGENTLNEDLGGITFQLDPLSFFQVHTAQAETLLRVVREGLDLQADQRLLDTYSGAGAFSLPLAHRVAEIVAVEEHPGSTEDGRISAALNNIGNVRFQEGQVERVLPTLDGSFDAAILDPPRRGCHPAALDGLLALAPTRIAYISCSPGILARDLKRLLTPNTYGATYTLRSVQPVDMFPQTPHIECVALLERQA